MWQNIIDEITKPLQQSELNNAPIFVREYIVDIFSRIGINIISVQWLVIITYGVLSILIAFLGLFIARLSVRFILTPVINRSKNRFDDFFLESKVFLWLARMVPFGILYFILPAVFSVNSIGEKLAQSVLSIALLIPVVGAVIAILNALRLVYDSSPLAKNRPIKGYIQIAKVLIVTFATLLIIGVVFDASVIRILGGLGAFSAVLLLIFRDPILAIVASAQLTLNDMVRIGDWIAISAERADGTVIDMNLQSIRIQNWDKSITSVPLYNLISESFVNWRGMEESGGRRIKRSINIDMTSVKFCTSDLMEKLKKHKLLKGYIVTKEQEISEFNTTRKLSPTEDALSSRAMTNLGTFRAYALSYLQQHPYVNHDMTCMVRQHQPTDCGIPIECYCFSAKQDWVEYENVQSDIFDHLIAVIPIFELCVFQSPSGSDFQSFGSGRNT